MRLEVGIIALVEEVFGTTAERRAQFEWLRNKPSREHFGEHYDAVMSLYAELQGDWEGTTAKADGHLTPDAYFPEPYHFIFEFDELQHFTQFRERTFQFYPANIPLAYVPLKYKQFCQQHHGAALAKGPERFRRHTADFPYTNGRAAQRAFFDTFRDWLPPLHGLNPTLRLAEFEVMPILKKQLSGNAAKAYMENLLHERLKRSAPSALE
ncbi:hypothetical protein C6503_24955 [Candidatus Poribacteria bacterium]|nr:MAG: hypothetical protein C6503_24955 [Candidatus Poribacteria bacterium]